MQNIPPGLIPYSHEKYLTGKYIAETRGGFRPDEVLYLNGSEQPVIFLAKTKQFVVFANEDGTFLSKEANHESDLFLRPKTVKKWHPVFKGMLCNSEHECLINWDDPNNSLVKAVEVEVNEE